MTSTAQQAKEDLGNRLHEIRRDAGLTGRQLAALAAWHFTKVSKLEHGTQSPSDEDIRIWCRLCDAEDQIADLIASLRAVESQYIEWRRMMRAGTKRRQQMQRIWEHESRMLRIYEPLLIPGIFHTATYAEAIVSTVISFYGIPDDLSQSIEARLARQDALYRGHRRFHVVIGEQALHTRMGSAETMTGQLGRLLEASTLHGVRLGIIPTTAVHEVWPLHGFWIFDERLVRVETYTAELTITQPREVGLYLKAFQGLADSAVHGQEARALITRALADLGESVDAT
ncbi:MAG: helix-turn-helix transcriptional regulator [Sporichthyaceae bacterium]|nr:helix-turn-helix transcriptional regulator [Sporichthyaceae bacterium]